MPDANRSPELNAIEEAYAEHVRNLFKVLVTNLIDGRVSRQTDQQSLQKFTAGLSFGKRARELALRAVQPPISTRLVIKRKRSKKAPAE
jgi:hypothetical protein